MVKDFFDLRNVFRYDPQFLLWVTQAFIFYVLHFVHGVFFLLSPLQLLIEEIENYEVETPHIISPWEVLLVEQWFFHKFTYNIVMSIEWSKWYCSSKISLPPLWHWNLVILKVFLGKTKVNDINMFIILRENEVWLIVIMLKVMGAYGFNISVNESSIVNFFDSI